MASAEIENTSSQLPVDTRGRITAERWMTPAWEGDYAGLEPEKLVEMYRLIYLSQEAR